jgi:hypothetical protein
MKKIASFSFTSSFEFLRSLFLALAFPFSPFVSSSFFLSSAKKKLIHYGPHLHEAVRPPLLEARDAHPDGEQQQQQKR